jgi:hypothetical protein
LTWEVSDGPGNADNEEDSGIGSLSSCDGGDTIYLTTYHTLVSKDKGESFAVQIDALSTSVAVNDDATWGVWSCGEPANQKVYYGDIGSFSVNIRKYFTCEDHFMFSNIIIFIMFFL